MVYSSEISLTGFSLDLGEQDMPLHAGVFLSVEQWF